MMATLNADGLVVVTGAGGFIGGHLVGELRRLGYAHLRAVDIKPLADWYQSFPDVDSRQLDLRERAACAQAAGGAREIYNLACDMGGMGFIETHRAECMLSVLINTHMLEAARDNGVERYFYSSSACVYAADKQTRPDVAPLKEEDAYPAMPEDGYGWEKLFSERMCRHFREDFGLETRVARYHNVYGPQGTYQGGREKAPAAICRKIIAAQMAGDGEIEVWGDGEQSRSFMYIDDCLHGTRALMASERDRSDQHRQRRARHDQSADRHRRGDRRLQVQAALQPRRAQRRARTLQRQHADHREARMGAVDPSSRRHGEDIPLDLATRWLRPRRCVASTPDSETGCRSRYKSASPSSIPSSETLTATSRRSAPPARRAAGCDLVVFSELVTIGYPPEDLVLRPAVIDATRQAVEALAADTAVGGAMLVTAPWAEAGAVYNAALLLAGGRIAAIRYKHELPNYGVFDEKRVFAAGPLPDACRFSRHAAGRADLRGHVVPRPWPRTSRSRAPRS